MDKNADRERASDVTALVLAGGLARRMGGADKGLVKFEGRPLALAVAERLAVQCAAVLVSANRNLDQYRALGLTPVSDRIPGFNGPLAGWEAACGVAKTPYIVSSPCDSPRVPWDLVARLRGALALHPLARAAAPVVRGKKEPVFALFSVELALPMRAALAAGEHRVGVWLQSMGCIWVPFDAPEDLAAFANFNTPEELRAAEALNLKSRGKSA